MAAITIPLLYTNYTEQERISKAKKTYSMLANAMTRVRADGGDMIFDVRNNNNESIKNWFDTYLKQYIITTKICYNTSGCWNDGDSKYMKGSNTAFNKTGIGIGDNIITAVLNDGTLINIDAYSSAYLAGNFGVDLDTTSGLVVFFDINGKREPNTAGKDIFVTVFTEDGLVPAGRDRSKQQIDSNCSSSGTGYFCLNKYLKK